MNNTIRNFFRDGLIMDLAPDNTLNSLLTNALNATFVTFNGNELSLQNDMGNARVETAMLPEGYIPIGSAELGGIIYIAAFNPFTNKCLLGSFPSPERNLEKEEIAPDGLKVMLSADKFQELNGEEPTGELKTTLHKIDLGMPVLHPGDKFYVCADTIKDQIVKSINREESWNSIITKHGYVIWAKGEDYPYFSINIWNTYTDGEKYTTIEESLKDKRNSELLVPDNVIWNGELGYVDIYLATINSENKIVKLELSEKSSGHVIGEAPVKKEDGNYDIDSYRKTMESNYDVYTAKESGKLYIVAELVAIDDFEVATKIEKTKVTWNFKTTSKYNVIPNKIIISGVDPDGNEIEKFDIDYPKEPISNISYEVVDEENGPILIPLLNKEGEYTITYTPVMPFGILDDLKVTLKLYYNTTEATNISEWRYYNADEYINLRFTINSTILSNELELNFYEYDNTAFSNTPNFTIKYNNLFSVSKNYTETIYLDKEYDTDYFLGSLNKDKFYRISIKLGTEELKKEENIYYLYLYTCPIFNGFYESLDYITMENSLEVDHGNPLYNFNLIDHTYGYKENETTIYPLQFTPEIEFISGTIESKKTNKTFRNLDKLIVEEKPEDPVTLENEYTLELQDKCIIQLKLPKDYGELFTISSSNPLIFKGVDINNNLYQNEVLTVSNIIKNTVNLNYEQRLVNVYNFKPLVYDEITANKYGIHLSKSVADLLGNTYYYARSVLSKYPMWYFFSEEGQGNKEFQSGTFTPNWNTGGSFSDGDHLNINNSLNKYLNMYDLDTIQHNIKETLLNCSRTKFPIIPHLFGFWELDNTCKEFCVVGNNINENYLLNSKEYIYYDYVNKYTKDTTYAVEDDYVQFYKNGKRIEVGYNECPKIWSFVMLDEDGDYKPVNCFMIQVNISDGLSSIFSTEEKNSLDCVSIGNNSYGESMMKQILDMLMSIYKVSEMDNQSLYIGQPEGSIVSQGIEIPLSIYYGNVELILKKDLNIPNLNYIINYSINGDEAITKTIEYQLLDDYKNDILDAILIDIPVLCKLNGESIKVQNLNPESLYYKTHQDYLNVMDKNFTWESSQSISIEENGLIKLNMPKESVKSNPWVSTVTGKFDVKEGKTITKHSIDIENELDYGYPKGSIYNIKVHINSFANAGGLEGTFSGFPLLVIKSNNKILKKILLDAINLVSDLLKSMDIKQTWGSYEQIIELTEPINFETVLYSNEDLSYIKCECTVEILNLSITGDVKATVVVEGLATYYPKTRVVNSGIGEYLTLKDGMLCLKGGLSGNDRIIQINAGGDNFITEWKFNSQIQFKNEFAI